MDFFYEKPTKNDDGRKKVKEKNIKIHHPDDDDDDDDDVIMWVKQE